MTDQAISQINIGKFRESTLETASELNLQTIYIFFFRNFFLSAHISFNKKKIVK